jgi:hypothetical protein
METLEKSNYDFSTVPTASAAGSILQKPEKEQILFFSYGPNLQIL